MGTPFASVRARRNDPAVCHPDDLIQFFNANSGVNWSISEVYKALPASKKEHTQKQQIYALLSALAKSGRLQRVGNGIYRLDKTADSEQ
jgi:Fe2+ or Zn2+ uptake regulation protein